MQTFFQMQNEIILRRLASIKRRTRLYERKTYADNSFLMAHVLHKFKNVYINKTGYAPTFDERTQGRKVREREKVKRKSIRQKKWNDFQRKIEAEDVSV